MDGKKNQFKKSLSFNAINLKQQLSDGPVSDGYSLPSPNLSQSSKKSPLSNSPLNNKVGNSNRNQIEEEAKNPGGLVRQIAGK